MRVSGMVQRVRDPSATARRPGSGRRRERDAIEDLLQEHHAQRLDRRRVSVGCRAEIQRFHGAVVRLKARRLHLASPPVADHFVRVAQEAAQRVPRARGVGRPEGMGGRSLGLGLGDGHAPRQQERDDQERRSDRPSCATADHGRVSGRIQRWTRRGTKRLRASSSTNSGGHAGWIEETTSSVTRQESSPASVGLDPSSVPSGRGGWAIVGATRSARP